VVDSRFPGSPSPSRRGACDDDALDLVAGRLAGLRRDHGPDAISEADGRVAIASWLLAPGLFHRSLSGADVIGRRSVRTSAWSTSCSAGTGKE
jgi:hypothetical protein